MMTFKYLLNPEKVGFTSETTKIEDVSSVHEDEIFIEVYHMKDGVDHILYIKIDDILLYETY